MGRTAVVPEALNERLDEAQAALDNHIRCGSYRPESRHFGFRGDLCLTGGERTSELAMRPWIAHSGPATRTATLVPITGEQLHDG